MRKYAFYPAAAFLAAVFFLQSPPAYCDGLTVVGEKGAYTFSYPEITSEFFGGAAKRLDDIIKTVAESEFVPALDAYIRFDPDAKKEFTPVKERAGKAIDREKLKDDILTALSVGGGSVKLEYKTVAPQKYLKDLDTDIVLRAKFTTSFLSSGEERSHNVQTACAAVSGSVIDSGEEFSFNGRVGKRTEERGYKSAKVISDGNFTEGVGGGVCQVSTTLYNAAILSGLTIAEYHPHTLSVGYVENSFDAMVSYGTSDLRIRNDTGAPVYIKGVVENKTITFLIYGKKSVYVYERLSKTINSQKATVKYEYDPLLDENEYVVVTPPKDGVESEGYLITKKNGEIIKTERIRTDSYRSVEGHIQTGRKSDADQG